MSTISVTDIAADQGGAKLEGHLKSPDFFGAEKFPTAKLDITKVVSRGTPGNFRITAVLSSITSETKPSTMSSTSPLILVTKK